MKSINWIFNRFLEGLGYGLKYGLATFLVLTSIALFINLFNL